MDLKPLVNMGPGGHKIDFPLRRNETCMGDCLVQYSREAIGERLGSDPVRWGERGPALRFSKIEREGDDGLVGGGIHIVWLALDPGPGTLIEGAALLA